MSNMSNMIQVTHCAKCKRTMWVHLGEPYAFVPSTVCDDYQEEKYFQDFQEEKYFQEDEDVQENDDQDVYDQEEKDDYFDQEEENQKLYEETFRYQNDDKD